jgi:Tol biopolymer transport system component
MQVEKLTQGKLEGLGLSWTKDGKIVYGSVVSESPDIWIMDGDGKNKRQLTSDPSVEVEPCVSFDGKKIVYLSNRNNGNWNIWTMDIDGSNKKQFLAEGTQGGFECSKGDNSIIFLGSKEDSFGLWKTSLDGGEAIPIPNSTRFRPAISSDGSKMAYTYWDPITKQMGQEVVAIKSLKPDELLTSTIEKFNLPLTAVGEYAQAEPSMRWTIDGKSLAFINEEKGIENIWLKTLSGGGLKKITNFTENSIYRYDWNADGKKLAVTRYSVSKDVMVIKIAN